MGMALAFTDDADFTGMADPPNPAERLKIDNVYHKAFVEVTEEGTEAAAATAVVMVARGAAMKVEQFVADHPFFFVIRDRRTNDVLFMGRVTDPS
jgi:serpin B